MIGMMDQQRTNMIVHMHVLALPLGDHNIDIKRARAVSIVIINMDVQCINAKNWNYLDIMM